VDATGGPGEDYRVLGSTASETEKKSSRRKKESSGKWWRSSRPLLYCVSLEGCSPSLSLGALMNFKQYYLTYQKVEFKVASSRILW
jgi:hypothetical protein